MFFCCQGLKSVELTRVIFDTVLRGDSNEYKNFVRVFIYFIVNFVHLRTLQKKLMHLLLSPSIV